jgi:hypothetical protein
VERLTMVVADADRQDCAGLAAAARVAARLGGPTACSPRCWRMVATCLVVVTPVARENVGSFSGDRVAAVFGDLETQRQLRGC